MLEDNGGSECDGGEGGSRTRVVAAGNAAPVLQAAELDFDAAATSVSALVVGDGHKPRFAIWDSARNALCLKASLNQSAS